MSARAAVALVATVAVVAGCTSAPTPVQPTPTPTATPTSASTSASTAAPTPDPGTDYRAALDATDRDLAAAFADIVDAAGYEDLRTALPAARAATERAAATLAAQPPPDQAAEHERVLRGLDALGAALTAEADRVQSREHCATSAVLASLAADPSVDELRGAVTGWGSFLPAPPPAPPASPPSGTLVVSPSEPGPGRFEVVNNRDVEVLVVLADATAPVLSMAVGAGQEAATDVVPDGDYEVYVAGGLEPDGAGGFARRCTYERLDEAASFVSTAESTTVLELTLEVIDGNVTATDVAPDDFPR